MADSFDVDLAEFEELSASLGRASMAMIREEQKVVFVALTNIKKGTRDRISKHPSWDRLAPTVNFDMFGVTGVVGYDDRGQGELASIAEYGSARHAPHPALMPAAKEEAPRFEKATLDVAAGVFQEALGGTSSRREYVTKDGRTILATDAQIANWTSR